MGLAACEAGREASARPAAGQVTVYRMGARLDVCSDQEARAPHGGAVELRLQSATCSRLAGHCRKARGRGKAAMP